MLEAYFLLRQLDLNDVFVGITGTWSQDHVP